MKKLILLAILLIGLIGCESKSGKRVSLKERIEAKNTTASYVAGERYFVDHNNVLPLQLNEVVSKHQIGDIVLVIDTVMIVDTNSYGTYEVARKFYPRMETVRTMNKDTLASYD